MSDIATKLTYLDTTREKILTETNRLGVGLTEQDKFRDYAKGLHDGYIDLLNNGTDTLYDNMEKVSGSGSEITLENTEEAPMKSEFEGDTTQEGTPTPDSPQPINVVSGRQDINVWQRNLFDNTIQPVSNQGSTLVSVESINTGKKMIYNGINSVNYVWKIFTIMDLTNYVGKTIRFKANFTASGNNIPQYIIGLCNADGSNRTSKASTKISGNTISFIVPALVGEQKYLSVVLYINEQGTIAKDDYVEFTNMILTIDDDDMTYEPYKGQSYEINLGNNSFDISTTNYTNKCTLSDNVYTTDALIQGDRNVIFGSQANNWTIYPNETYYFSADMRLVSGTSKNINAFRFSITGGTTTMIINPDYTNEFQRYLCSWTNSTGNIVNTGKILFQPNNTNLSNAIFEFKNVMVSKSPNVEYTPYKTPIELCKINTYKDMIFRSKGVNLFDGSIYKESVVISSTGVESYNGNFNLYKMYLKPNTTYTIQFKSTDTTVRSSRYIAYKSNDTFIEMVKEFTYDTNENVVQTFTTPNETSYILFHIGKLISNVMINEGSTALPYEPYNSKGKWLLHKEIGKVVLNGSESWETQSIKTNTTAYSLLSNIGCKATGSDSINAFVNYFKGNTNGYNVDEQCFWFNGSGYLRLRISNTIASTVAQFKTWLSTHNTIVYYVLATPTTTEITDTELISQLEEFYNAKSNKDVTYISVTSEDLPAILNVIAIKKYE